MSTYLADEAEDLVVEGRSARFTYRRLGPRGGVPLVLLNRFRGTIDWWDPEFVDRLAAGHDVIMFDNVGIGYTTGEPQDSVEEFADGAVDFVEALGLSQVDLLGWSLGGVVAQHVALRRPELVRRLVVAGSGSGMTPDMPEMASRVLEIMAKPDADEDDLLYLFYPETDAARAAGAEHLAKVSKRLAAGGPAVSETAANRQLEAIGKAWSVPWEQVRANLETIEQPVLYANGMHDVMVPAQASYLAVEQLDSAVLVLYSDAGHAFLFQRAEAFARQVTDFLAD
ncbi:alpha/beta hydrolase [Saccharopolyspora sp. NPDC049426]|uniref:alpha/beta fold hydrolase n=1 Tax=Saccharopolyspora sp. NPDC049426 TaxID=3155652 RepID=UPI00342628ED